MPARLTKPSIGRIGHAHKPANFSCVRIHHVPAQRHLHLWTITQIRHDADGESGDIDGYLDLQSGAASVLILSAGHSRNLLAPWRSHPNSIRGGS
jgi:hypothetical protein